MRKLLILFLVATLVAPVSADLQEVQYEIEAGKERIDMNVSISMSCDYYCTGIEWSLPEDSRVTAVRNGRGEMDYTVEGETVSIPGTRSRGRENQTIRIGIRVSRDAEEVYRGLYKRTVSIPSFQGVTTTGFVSNDDLISGWIGYGFDYSFSDTEMRFRGEGPTNIRVKWGEGNRSRYFVFFGGSPEDTEQAYTIPVGTTGLVQRFERFPVAVMDDETFNRTVNRWSAGEYVGGSIRIRKPESAGSDFIPVLGHEVVHGLNDRFLSWDQTRSSYFDEGTAKYVEFLIRKKMYNQGEIDKPTRELFGDSVRYDPDPSDNRYFKLPPKGEKEKLWSYYQNNRDFMKTWNALESRPEIRDFGYAYSELIIRNYIVENNSSLKKLYDRIDVNQKISDPEKKWQVFSSYLDMTPCSYSSREKFDACLEKINSYDYPVYSAEPSRNDRSLDIRKLKIPNRTERSSGVKRIGEVDLKTEVSDLIEFLKGFLSYLGSFFRGI